MSNTELTALMLMAISVVCTFITIETSGKRIQEVKDKNKSLEYQIELYKNDLKRLKRENKFLKGVK